MNLSALVDRELVFPDLVGNDAAAVLRNMTEKLAAAGVVPNAEALYEKLVEREHLGSTAIGHGVAIPHCKLGKIKKVVLAVGRAPDGVPASTPDGEPVRLFFVVISPEGHPASHLQSLAAISKWVKNDKNLDRVERVRTQQELYDCLRAGDDNGS